MYHRDMQKLWFAAKRYGWGWVPCSWEGWVITIIAAVTIGMNVAMVDGTSHSVSDTLIGSVFPTVVIAALLIIICYLTGEKPRWRWGGK